MDTDTLRKEVDALSQAVQQPGLAVAALRRLWARLYDSAPAARHAEQTGWKDLAQRWDRLAERLHTILMEREHLERRIMADADYPPRPAEARRCFECWLEGQRVWQIHQADERSLVPGLAYDPEIRAPVEMPVVGDPVRIRTAIWRCANGHELRQVY